MILHSPFRWIETEYRQAGDDSLDQYSCNSSFLISLTSHPVKMNAVSVMS
jgi:hypothetical protein